MTIVAPKEIERILGAYHANVMDQEEAKKALQIEGIADAEIRCLLGGQEQFKGPSMRDGQTGPEEGRMAKWEVVFWSVFAACAIVGLVCGFVIELLTYPIAGILVAASVALILFGGLRRK